MRPFDEIPFEESDYSDVALMVASVREWPADDFARGLDARVARRFAPEAAPTAHRNARGGRGSIRRWAAGSAVALVAGVVAVVVVLSSGGGALLSNGPASAGVSHAIYNHAASGGYSQLKRLGASQAATSSDKNSPNNTQFGASTGATGSAGTLTSASAATNAGSGAATLSPAAINTTAAVAPGAKQIRSAQLDLTTQNVHVNAVAQEIFGVVSAEHGTVLSSHITTATSSSGGGYASFSLSVPTGNLQDVITELSRLHYVAVVSSDNSSTNVGHQYNSDQRQLADAKALRTSLLKQLAAAETDQQIDSIKAQIKLAEQQITSWQNTLGSLQHKISYSDLSVQLNQNGLPVVVTHKPRAAAGFTLSRAGHDALRVLIVAAGVALIALAVMIPVGLVAALLMWLWVWLRQRRREHALDVTA